ncbi:MAG: methyltransferase domain-containing protein [Elusimicrobia bacterium]|nr:MAG: methyltransferase domain-containing protein [Elusimicrobiota bacterium]
MNLFPDLRFPVDEDEWMDTRGFDPDRNRRALRYLAFTNRRFGGARAILRPLSLWSRRWHPGEPVHLLDVGTGGADIPIAIAQWGRRRGFSLRITAVELPAPIAALAKEAARPCPELTVLPRDLRDMPQELTFDYVTASLFLHHVPVGLRAEALRAMDRRARKGLVISDLRRGLLPYWAAGAASVVWGDSVLRHDSPLAVRRSFRKDELESLARETGLAYLRARKESWFRLSLSGEKA